jgi:hypothetical protein
VSTCVLSTCVVALSQQQQQQQQQQHPPARSSAYSYHASLVDRSENGCGAI